MTEEASTTDPRRSLSSRIHTWRNAHLNKEYKAHLEHTRSSLAAASEMSASILSQCSKLPPSAVRHEIRKQYRELLKAGIALGHLARSTGTKGQGLTHPASPSTDYRQSINGPTLLDLESVIASIADLDKMLSQEVPSRSSSAAQKVCLELVEQHAKRLQALRSLRQEVNSVTRPAGWGAGHWDRWCRVRDEFHSMLDNVAAQASQLGSTSHGSWAGQ